MSEPAVLSLPEVLEFREGPGILAVDFRDSGVPLLRLAGLKQGAPLLSGCNYLDPSMVAKKWKQFQVKQGDVLLSTSASLGEVAAVDVSAVGAVPYTGIIAFRPRDKRVLAEFIPLMLTERSFKLQIEAMGVGSVMKHFGPSHLRNMTVTVPPVAEQRAIAEVLGALNDKIAANTKLVATSAQLAMVLLQNATHDNAVRPSISDVTTLLIRGITPSYTEDEDQSMVVLNQKCVRGQRVDLSPSRRTSLSKVRAGKILVFGDVLVNSTGQGTLGRVARWTGRSQATVDSHITIARFDSTKVDPTCAGYAMLELQPAIEELGEGSTGQTELSRVELGKLNLTLPPFEASRRLGVELAQMAEMEDAMLSENRLLATTRDTLLPELMSGRLRVKDAEKKIGEVV